MEARKAKVLIPFTYVAAVLSICQYALGDEQIKLTVDDFDLSGDGAPYEAARLIVDNWLRREDLKTRPEYEIPVYNLKGQLTGYYFIGYSGEGEPPLLDDVIEEYGKSPVLEIMKQHGEPHAFVKYGKDLRTFTVVTRFASGSPDTGSHAGVPYTLVCKYWTDKTAERVLGTSDFEYKHVDFEGFNGSVYSHGDRTIYIPVLRYLVGDETYYTSLEELYEAELGAKHTPVSEELLETQRTWWREIIERHLNLKYNNSFDSFDFSDDLDPEGYYDFPLEWNQFRVAEGAQWWDDNNPPYGGPKQPGPWTTYGLWPPSFPSNVHPYVTSIGTYGSCYSVSWGRIFTYHFSEHNNHRFTTNINSTWPRKVSYGSYSKEVIYPYNAGGYDKLIKGTWKFWHAWLNGAFSERYAQHEIPNYESFYDRSSASTGPTTDLYVPVVEEVIQDFGYFAKSEPGSPIGWYIKTIGYYANPQNSEAETKDLIMQAIFCDLPICMVRPGFGHQDPKHAITVFGYNSSGEELESLIVYDGEYLMAGWPDDTSKRADYTYYWANTYYFVAVPDGIAWVPDTPIWELTTEIKRDDLIVNWVGGNESRTLGYEVCSSGPGGEKISSGFIPTGLNHDQRTYEAKITHTAGNQCSLKIVYENGDEEIITIHH